MNRAQSFMALAMLALILSKVTDGWFAPVWAVVAIVYFACAAYAEHEMGRGGRR